jgi:hypothetical protein
MLNGKHCFSLNDFKVTDSECDTLNNLKVPITKSENKRIETLRETALLDSMDEEEYDRFTTLCCRIFNVNSF